MSLINEALKRAQQDAGRPGRTRETAELPLCENQTRSHTARYAIVTTVVVLAGAAAVSVWMLTQPLPQGATAQQAPPSARPVVPVVEPPDPESYRTNRPMSPEAEQAYQKTLVAVQTYQETLPPGTLVRPEFDDAKPADSKKPASALDITDALAAVKPPAMELRAAVPAPTPDPATAPKGKTPAAPQPPATAKDTPPTPAPQPLITVEDRPFDPENYHLTGIMNGPEGTVVIINGFPVQLGDIVEDAKVVLIERYSVVLEVNGRNFRLRM